MSTSKRPRQIKNKKGEGFSFLFTEDTYCNNSLQDQYRSVHHRHHEDCCPWCLVIKLHA